MYITTVYMCNLCMNAGKRGGSTFMPKHLITLHTSKLVAHTIGSFISIVLLSHLYMHNTHETCTMSKKHKLHTPIARLIQCCYVKNKKEQEPTF